MTVHTIKINSSKAGENVSSYHSPVCSCGWSGGCWASYENARIETYNHEQAIKYHMIGHTID